MSRQPILISATETGTMHMLPAKEGTCETCATAHDPDQPHNAQSIFYQMRFQLEHGRGPTWIDAMEHCTEAVRAVWTAELVKLSVDVEGGEINPPRKAK